MTVRSDDGSEMTYGPGDVFLMEPGHDAWTVGDVPAFCSTRESRPTPSPPDRRGPASRRPAQICDRREGCSVGGLASVRVPSRSSHSAAPARPPIASKRSRALNQGRGRVGVPERDQAPASPQERVGVLQPVGEGVPPHRRRAEPFDGLLVPALRLRQQGLERRSGCAGRVACRREWPRSAPRAGPPDPGRPAAAPAAAGSMSMPRDRARTRSSIPAAAATRRFPSPAGRARGVPAATRRRRGPRDHVASAARSRTRRDEGPGVAPELERRPEGCPARRAAAGRLSAARSCAPRRASSSLPKADVRSPLATHQQGRSPDRARRRTAASSLALVELSRRAGPRTIGPLLPAHAVDHVGSALDEPGLRDARRSSSWYGSPRRRGWRDRRPRPLTRGCRWSRRRRRARGSWRGSWPTRPA